jgi:glycosyltransferase involved in cell wall biosynthesis
MGGKLAGLGPGRNSHELIKENVPVMGAKGHRAMRILHLLAPAGVGGLERVVHALAVGQVRRGDQVLVALVVTAAGPIRDWAAELKDAGVAVEVLVVGAREYRKERAHVAALCQRFGPDVVHTHGFRPDVVDAGVARKLGIPCVTTLHGTTGETLRTRLYEWLQQRMARRFNAVVAVSRALGERLERQGMPRARLHVVPNAWSGAEPPVERTYARRQLGFEGAEFALGWVGRLSHEKGADVMIDAMGELKDLPISLMMVGDGRERARLEARAAARSVSDRVRWTGAVPNAGRLFPAFDAWVLSSRTEGTPIVLFEAMAAEVPIVATRVGGVPDVVGEAEAVLVAPEQPDALARAIRRVHADPDAARQRAQRARERLERDYQSEPWLDRYDEIYRKVTRESLHGIANG